MTADGPEWFGSSRPLGRLLRGAIVSLIVMAVAISSLIAFDVHLHKKFDSIAGLNYRGYRGRVLGRKAVGEVRLGLFGGSVAMGYGVRNDRSIAAFAERALNSSKARADRSQRFTVVNLASNGEAGLAFFEANYQLFRYLDLDTLIFYVLGGDARSSMARGVDVQEWASSQRSSDPVLRIFGYYFIFPTVARERYYLMRYGSVEKGYLEDTLLNGFDRMSSAVLSRKATATESLTDFIRRLVGEHKSVIFALCPRESADGPDPWSAFKQYYGERFAGDPGVVIADLNAVFPTADRSSYFVDGLHYSEKGNRVIAEDLARRYIER